MFEIRKIIEDSFRFSKVLDLLQEFSKVCEIFEEAKDFGLFERLALQTAYGFHPLQLTQPKNNASTSLRSLEKHLLTETVSFVANLQRFSEIILV